MSETILEIHMPNLRHNYNFLRNRLSVKTRILAVVKAFGYGSDAIEIAHFLVNQGVDYFGVAYTHEGVQLRKSGISKPILVLHPQEQNLDLLIKNNLEPGLYSNRILNAFLEKLNYNNKTSYPIHLKFNTGLNRLGFHYTESQTLSESLKENKSILIKGVYTHLAASDDITEREFTLSQLNKFSQIFKDFNTINSSIIFHALNTSGVLQYPNAQYDMVRTGISLYGYGNDSKIDEKLKPVLKLKTVISQINILEAGDSLGYNRAFIAKTKTKTATLPLGHADGIGRIYGNGKGYVMINSQRAAILGNVCMDMIMVDISEIECKEGDDVIVLGPGASAEELAGNAGTISYELITGLSQRIKRSVIH